MPNVAIATTMWGKVGKEEGDKRENELKCSYWKDMVDNGCMTERFELTYGSAWRIIGALIRRQTATPFDIQKELDAGKPLPMTKAGSGIESNPKPSTGLLNMLRSFFSW